MVAPKQTQTEALLVEHRILGWTKGVLERHPGYYAGFPPAVLALEVRTFVKFCDQGGIDDPDLQADLIEAAFAPHPSRLAAKDLEYVQYLIGNGGAEPFARASAARNHLSGAR